MKKQNLQQPNRQLSINFTDTTLRRAIVAKRRSGYVRTIKELFTMKNKRKFLKRPAGAFLALAIIVMGGTGVYAAANWFGGIVSISSDASIMTVDLSKCQGKNLPAGIDGSADPSNVKFKITGEPHISEKDLQRKLLANCEDQTIHALYREKYGITPTDVGVVKAVDPLLHTATVEVNFGGKTFDKTMSLAPSVTVYDKGQDATLANIKSGDYVMIAFDLERLPLLENENPYDQQIGVKSIFKTRYDLREVRKDGKSLYGSPNNVMPLEQYEEIRKKGL